LIIAKGELNKMKKSKLITTALLFLLSLSMCAAVVTAQYITEKTTPVTIGPDGKFSGGELDIGVAYEIEGTVGATGSITAQIYNGNPQSTASIPESVSLTRFVAITFNMNPADFIKANIYITYTDADVANLQAPFTVYKYNPDTDSYVEVVSTVDTAAKMVTFTLNSISDPLFAIGGAVAPQNTDGFSTTAWALLAASIAIIVALAVFGVWYFKKYHA
jgi:hypothetical protein